ARADLIDRHVIAIERLLEPKRVVEALGNGEILGGQEGARGFAAGWYAQSDFSVSRRGVRGCGSCNSVQTKSCSFFVRAAITAVVQLVCATMSRSNLYFSACAIRAGSLAPKSPLPIASLAL